MKIRIYSLLIFLVSFNILSQTRTVTTTNLYSIRFINNEQYTNIMCICNFGEVIKINEFFQGGDIGAHQTTKHWMENRTIITFDLDNIPLAISNKMISKATLILALQNQQNGLPGSKIDIHIFHDKNLITTNYWAEGIYYSSFFDVPNVQEIDITGAVKSAKQNNNSILGLRMSTELYNFSCIFIK